MSDELEPIQQQHIAVPAGQIEFCDLGSGLPVLYFHGTGAGNDAAVLLEHALLEAGCRLIVPNRPGYHNSSLADSGSVDCAAQLAAQLLDHLQLQRVAVIGTSGGGMPAAAFARLFPQRTSGLVLQCAQSHRWDDGQWLPRGLESALPLFRWKVFRPLLRWINGRAARAAQRDPVDLMRKMSGSRFPLIADDSQAEGRITLLAQMMVACAAQPAGIENDWAILIGDNGLRDDQHIQCPTLVIHDREDPLVPFRHAEWSRSCIPQAQLLEIGAAGHLIWFGPGAETMHRQRLAFLRASHAA